MACNIPTFRKVTSIPIDKHKADIPFDAFGNINPFVDPVKGRFKNANSGIVQIKVLINRLCPFRKSPKIENILTFNSETIQPFPRHVQQNLEATPGVEGLTLKRRYLYRHNFLFDSNYNPIREDLAFVTGEPKYKPFTTWIQIPSVFGEQIDVEGCGDNPKFDYTSERVTDYTEPLAIDTKNDGVSPSSRVQAINQINAQTCARSGVHWRVQKVEDTYQGEDFFIHFFSKVEPGARNTKSVNANLQTKFLNGSGYDYLDAALDENSVSFWVVSDNIIPVNHGVAAYKYESDNQDQQIPEKIADDTRYLLTNQAYLIIEIGQPGGGRVVSGMHADNGDHHYFIIITDRGAPRLVVNRGGISFVLGELTDINGSTLFDLPHFRVTVQNYLGKFLIRFEGPGLNIPWVVERFDWVVDEGTLTEKTAMAVVPEGKLSIWGGNNKVSFAYGPLQYIKRYFFTTPPRGPANVLGITALSSENTNLVSALPVDGKHRFTFSSSDVLPQDVLPSTTKKVSSNKDPVVNEIFTCDAQQFFMFNEISGSTKDSKEIKDGNFYGGSHYKAKGGFHTPTSSFPVLDPTTWSTLFVNPHDLGIDASRRLRKYSFSIMLKAGTHEYSTNLLVFATATGKDRSVWRLDNCKTPILTVLKLISDDPDEARRWEPQCVDVTEHVMKFSDSWVAQDFNRIEHTGDISFLLNKGASYENNQTEFLKSLTNKSFYIEVWAGYKDCNYSKLNGLFKLFTGLCNGGTVEFSAGRRVISCQINDYTSALEGQRIFNSPFFDGVIDLFAIKELLSMAGFRAKGSGEFEEKPVALIEHLKNNSLNGESLFYVHRDGRISYLWPYVLPSSYARLQDPKFKFTDASTFMEAIDQITRRAGKLFFFDQDGIAHYESYLDSVINNLLLNTSSTSTTTGTNNALQTRPLFWFTSHPSKYTGQQIFNQYTIFANVADVRNHIKILSNTPNFTPIFGDELEWDSIEDPTSEGFLGYPRMFYQSEGAFGDEATAARIIQFYRAFFRPPLLAKFETYGQPARALDLVVLNNHPYRVMRVDSTIEPERNLWWQTFECEWFHKVAPRDDG